MRSRRAARAAVLLLALGASAVTRPAYAESAPILDLDWSAPAECPDAARVTARVEQLVGRTHGNKTLTAKGRMTGAKGRYRLALRAGSAPERRMNGADCAHLAAAAAVILALDIDPEALSHANDGKTAPESPPHESPPRSTEGTASEDARVRAPDEIRRGDAPAVETGRTTRTPPPDAGVKERGRRDVELGLAARLLFDLGSLPSATLGLGVAVGIARGPLFFDAGPAIYQRRFVGALREETGGAYVDLVTLGARACARESLADVGLRLCLGGELGRESTSGVGLAETESSSGLWGAATIGAEARAWRKRRFSPAFGIDVGHPFAAPDVIVHNFGTLFERPLLFFRAHLALELRFF